MLKADQGFEDYWQCFFIFLFIYLIAIMLSKIRMPDIAPNVNVESNFRSATVQTKGLFSFQAGGVFWLLLITSSLLLPPFQSASSFPRVFYSAKAMPWLLFSRPILEQITQSRVGEWKISEKFEHDNAVRIGTKKSSVIFVQLFSLQNVLFYAVRYYIKYHFCSGFPLALSSNRFGTLVK